ncbi:odorant receptor 13a-like [Epargyreus clarus]|uniref:odorant receptor 13a-like n=1 Tax=Epargyreus clarus TaxID=520877 RepID=UPI003C2FA20D
MFESFKTFFTKSDFDYESPDIDLYKFHPQLRALLVFNGIFFNNTDSYWRFLWPSFSIATTAVACAFEMMFMYHGYKVKDYTFATESFCYFLVMGTIPLVYASLLMNRTKILKLLDDMNTDFKYICSLGEQYKNKFLQGQLIIWQLCIVWLVFFTAVCAMFIITTILALLYQSLFETQTEYTTRPLPFTMWLPEDDPYRTPNYEVFMFWHTIISILVPQTFGVYVYVLFHLLLHYFYLMNMIIFDFEVLFDGLDESVAKLSWHDCRRVNVQRILNSRMRRIVKWHMSVFKSVEAVSSIYGPPLVYQVMFSSIAICLIAYQIADSLDHGKFHFTFSLMLSATCVQLWIPCYLGTLIRNKGFSVGEACWNCGWEDTSLGRLVCQDILIVIMRAQRPVLINFTGLPNVELETFSSIMSTSYSYFNLLRQYK